MKDDLLPVEDTVSRFIGGSKVIGNRVSGQAFRLRSDEDALSVNWLEFLSSSGTREEQIEQVRQVFINKNFTLGATAKFAALNVNEITTQVERETGGNSIVTVKHDPLDDDPSHSGIYDIPLDSEDIIAETIAMLVKAGDLFPAK